MPVRLVITSRPRPFVPFRGTEWCRLVAAPLPEDPVLAEAYRGCPFARVRQIQDMWTVSLAENALSAVMPRQNLRFVPFCTLPQMAATYTQHEPLFAARIACNNNIPAVCVYTPPLWLLLYSTPGGTDCLDVAMPAQFLFLMYYTMLVALQNVNYESDTSVDKVIPEWLRIDDVDEAYRLACIDRDRDTIVFHVQTFASMWADTMTAALNGGDMPAAGTTLSDVLAGLQKAGTLPPPLADDVVRESFDRVVGYSTESVPLDQLCDALPQLRYLTPTREQLAHTADMELATRRITAYMALLASRDEPDAAEAPSKDTARERLAAIAGMPLPDDFADAIIEQAPRVVAAAPSGGELAALEVPPRRGPLTEADREKARATFMAERKETRARVKQQLDKMERRKARAAAMQEKWVAQMKRINNELQSLADCQLQQALTRWRTDAGANIDDLFYLMVQTINNIETALMTIINVPISIRDHLRTRQARVRPEHVPADIVDACDTLAAETLCAAESPGEAETPLVPPAMPRSLLTGRDAAAFNEMLMHKLRHWDSFTAPKVEAT